MKKLADYLIQGIILIAPLGITIYIIVVGFQFLDGLLNNLISRYLDIDIPGLGVLAILILLVLVGVFAQTVLTKPFNYLLQRIFKRAPLLKVLYTAIQDLFSAFVGKEKKFSKPVLVLVNPISHLEKIGFLTEEDLSQINEVDKMAVYFPHSYNFSGEMFIVPTSQIKALDIDPATAMKFVVSGGVSGFDPVEDTNQ